MLIRAEETHARAPQEATEALSNAVRNYDQDEKPSDYKKSVFRFWWGEHRSTVCNFESAPNHHPDQERDDDKAQANERALPPIQAMDNFRPATGADTCAIGNRRLAVWARESFHIRIIIARMFRTNRFFIRSSSNCDLCS